MIQRFLQWLKYRRTPKGNVMTETKHPITGDLEEERGQFLSILGKNNDVKFREFHGHTD